MANSIPELLNTIRVTTPDLAQWSGRVVTIVRHWRAGSFLPPAKDRARLVNAVRKHAHELLTLADAVEREGEPEA